MPSERTLGALFILITCVAAGFIPLFLMMGINFTPALPPEMVRIGSSVARICPIVGLIVGCILAYAMRDRNQ